MSGDLVPHFPNHIRQTARALSLAGYSSESIASQIAQLYPGDDAPSAPTIRRWRSTQSELTTEELEAQSQLNREIALVASNLVLQDLQTKPESINTQQKMIISGIAQSKEHERLQRAQPTQDNRQLVIVVNNPMLNDTPLTIDA